MKIIFLSLIFLISSCNQADMNKQMLENSKVLLKDIRLQVAKDAIEQYNISVSGGDKIEICVKAGFVAEAFNQAGDSENYMKWKLIQNCDCVKSKYPDQKFDCP